MTEKGNNYPPKGLLRLGFRLPVYFYRFGLGWMLGKRFVLINHVGRKTGLPRQAVVEVVEREKGSGTITVVAGYGEKAQWYQNLRIRPEIIIQVGNRKIPVIARFVPPEKGEEIMLRYYQRYGAITGMLFKLLGYRWDGSVSGLRQMARNQLRFVIFEPKEEKPQK